jgi:hypothetical protein
MGFLFMHLKARNPARVIERPNGWRINQSPIAGGSVSMYAPGEANQHTYSYGAQLRAKAFK